MSKIFFVLGKSCSGKDTIFQSLKENKQLNLKTVVGYTTRPMRVNEKNGVEYFFVDQNKLEELKKAKKVIECRDYNTVYGIWSYFTVDDGQIDLNNGDYLYIGTLESYEQMIDFYGEDVVVPLYIQVETGERLARAVNRERNQSEPKYKELCRRFLADEEDFSGEKIEKACLLSFVLLFSTLSQSIVATTVYAGNILMMEQDSELPVKEDQADITDQDHQEKNTDTENTNSDKEQGTEESTDSDKIVTAYV